jgi:hypothetical protein
MKELLAPYGAWPLYIMPYFAALTYYSLLVLRWEGAGRNGFSRR